MRPGPKSSSPSGRGYVTAKGYIRLHHNGRLRMEHVVVWEEHNGPVPPGHQVHHRNGIKHDNRIENLELVDPTTHKRLHSGCELRDGVWWKPCRLCGDYKPIDVGHWYLSAEGWPLYGRCRPCHIAKVVDDKRERKRRAA